MSTYHWYNKDTFNLDELVMYGSSRLGTIGANQYLTDTITRDSAWWAAHPIFTNPLCDSINYDATGLKQYEFTNHLGNVLVTLTDKHIPFYFGSFAFYYPEVASAQDYYPFGMEMVGSAYNPKLYRFGFNKGSEKDNEIYGIGNAYSTLERELDVRRGQWMAIDPETHAFQSPYSSMDDNPITVIDPEGSTGLDAIVGVAIGYATNILPVGGPISSYIRENGYHPSDPSDYNAGLQTADQSTFVIGNAMMGAGALGTGTGLAIAGGAGVATAASGGTAAPVTIPAAAAGLGLAGASTEVGAGGAYLSLSSILNKQNGYHYGEQQPAQSQVNSEQTKANNEKQADKANNRQKTYQTYKKDAPSGSNDPPYHGRTSGKGTPERNVAKRDVNHQMKGYGPAVLDKSSTNPDAIRGREDMNIEKSGGAKSQGGTSSNQNRGISDRNPKKQQYIDAAKKEFGK